MAQKSTREGLKKEYVDYLGNLIIEGKIKRDITDLTNGLYPSKQSFNNLADSLAREIETRTASDEDIMQDMTELGETKANKSDVLSYEEIQASTDLAGKITSASAFKNLYDFLYPRYIDKNWHIAVDLNNFMSSGIYLLGYDITNRPSSLDNNAWSPMLVLGNGTDTCRQIIIDSSSNMYIRARQSSIWHEWRTL